MNDLFYRLKNLPYYLCPAFIMSAVVIFLINLITLIPGERFLSLYNGFFSGISALFAFAAAGLICYAVSKNTKKALASGFCILLFDIVLFSLCNVHISFVTAVILSLVFAFIYGKNDFYPAFFACSLLSLVLALCVGLSYDFLYSALKSFCLGLKGKGALFGTVNNLYSILFSDNLEKLFYHKDFSGTAFVDGKIVSGVMDVFSAQGIAGINASKFLSGKYFVNIFLSVGIFSLIFPRLDREGKAAVFLCLLNAVVFGDTRLFALFVLVFNPLMYFGYLLLVFLSYFFANLLDIRMMFFRQGSLIEMFKYMDKPFYFLLAGAVLAVLSFFVENIIISKFDFQSKRILPYEVRKIVNSLGGESNIERINKGELLVKNPNLINILNLDCEIRGNRVKLLYDDLEKLKQFL